jgi:DNA-binding IclR family transcriptional regulator
VPVKRKAATRSDAGPKYNVPALEKGLDILETLSAASVPMSLSELAAELNRTSSELFRMLVVLERRAYVTRDAASGNYRLSLRLYELAHTHSPVDQLLQAASLPMRQLTEQVRESCHLSILNRGQLVILQHVESPEKIRLSVEVGAQFSPIHTNSGRLLMAFLRPEELSELLESDSEARALTNREKTRVLGQLERIRSDGHFISDSETRPGMKDVSVPVGQPHVGLLAALCIPCLLGGKDEPGQRKILRSLGDCARRIRENLGFSADLRINP